MNGAMSPQEVADRIGVSKDTVLRLLRSGRLPGVKIGWRSWRITEDNLAAFMDGKQTKKAKTPKTTAKGGRV
jgi:excisionase family DNA binding protein